MKAALLTKKLEKKVNKLKRKIWKEVKKKHRVCQASLVAKIHYTENIIGFPKTSWYCSKLTEVKAELTHAELGIPEDKFIYCSFAHPSYISEQTLKLWSSILKQTQNSILWLNIRDEETQKNLKSSAEKNGIDSSRLYFLNSKMSETSKPLYLANLYLTPTENCEPMHIFTALWHGVPVVSFSGNWPNARIPGSILHNTKYSNLIATTEKDYVLFAISQYLKHSIKKKDIQVNLHEEPCFSMDTCVKYLEKSFAKVYEKYIKDGKRKDISIELNLS